MKILVLNGPNLNMLGIREPNLYGISDYNALAKLVKDTAKCLKIKVTLYQSNYEGDLVTKIQKAYKKYDGIVINPAGYTHTSVAILDALKAVNIPTVEVHISDVNNREDFRKISFVREYAEKTISGKGLLGYQEAIKYLVEKHNK